MTQDTLRYMGLPDNKRAEVQQYFEFLQASGRCSWHRLQELHANARACDLGDARAHGSIPKLPMCPTSIPSNWVLVP